MKAWNFCNFTDVWKTSVSGPISRHEAFCGNEEDGRVHRQEVVSHSRPYFCLHFYKLTSFVKMEAVTCKETRQEARRWRAQPDWSWPYKSLPSIGLRPRFSFKPFLSADNLSHNWSLCIPSFQHISSNYQILTCTHVHSCARDNWVYNFRAALYLATYMLINIYMTIALWLSCAATFASRAFASECSFVCTSID